MQPLPGTDRYAPLDVLRGIALSGVLIVNVLTLFRVSLMAHMIRPDESVVSTLVAVLVEFKAFTLFSFLFGVGVAVQAERAAPRGGAAAFLVRRFLVLLGIGLIHMVLIWNGDILTLYAVCGLLLIPILGIPSAMLSFGGVALIAASYLGVMPVHLPGHDALARQAAEATRVYAAGGFVEILRFRQHETLEFIGPLLLLTLPKTLGVMMLGVAAWRSGLLTGGRKYWPAILIGGAVTGIAGTILRSDLFTHVPVAFAYAAAVLLWLPKAPLLAAGGQMALTNYLMQSVVFCFVFYGYGLGQFGRLEVWPVVAGGVVFYMVQLWLSRAWLLRFHFGPVEWVWRSLTYGRRQQMIREGAWLLSHGGLRLLMVMVFLIAIPLIHGGIPWMIGMRGPRWGWNSGAPGLVNYTGLIAVGGSGALLVWILATGWRAVRDMPLRVPLGLRPASLLKTGPYAWTRHPIYLAEILLWVGVGVYWGSPAVMATIAAGVVIGGRVVIPREERALESYFGEEYREYRRRVPGLPSLNRSFNRSGS